MISIGLSLRISLFSKSKVRRSIELLGCGTVSYCHPLLSFHLSPPGPWIVVSRKCMFLDHIGVPLLATLSGHPFVILALIESTYTIARLASSSFFLSPFMTLICHATCHLFSHCLFVIRLIQFCAVAISI